MLDINKYLENQLALAKQRCEAKNQQQKNIVSEKSVAFAETISRKQDKALNKSKGKPIEEIKETLSITNSSTDQPSDDDSEYIPSCDEDDEDITLPSLSTITNSKKHVKKIIDDGDSKLYKQRLAKWEDDLKAVASGHYEGPVTSADLQFVLDGNEDVNKGHQLKNGLKVPYYIWKQLYKYQRTGVKWLWELHQVKSGGLLGDEMGLGKTVQIIAFLAGLSKSEIGSWCGLGPSMIVAPATVIYQWVSHFHYWCPHIRVAVLHHSGSHAGHYERLLRDIYNDHGILMITYAGIVKYHKHLICKPWHYVILDEGHKIRNPETQVSKLIKKFPTSHKLIITGSPMQNSLMELWSLFDFMRPGLLGTQNAFMEHFALPITQGGYANATEFQEVTALETAKALKDIITPYMLRRTKAEVQEHIKLPEKSEQVLFCALSEEQRDLYMGYLRSGTVRSILDKEHRYGDPLRTRILVGLSTLRKICNHPDLYLYEADEMVGQINEHNFGHWKRSGKMLVVHSLLKIWQKQGHRALIFTQSRAMICILEQHFQKHNYKYLRMDGTVNVSQRQNLIKTFNENIEYLVFLATTRVGGLGVNLTGADRVIIYDPDWNPATDTQAKERAWRIGQQRNVTVYRLLSAGTIEEKIYQRQVFKQLLSNKVLADPNQKNILTTSTLQGLFTLEDLNQEGDTETASLFKHTKVNLKAVNKPEKNNEIHLSGGVSFSKQKLEAMRNMAKKISKQISKNSIVNDLKVPKENPREMYKKKRELLLNPPIVEEPQINLVDDKITDVPFENILSELDIVNMHTKKNYEEQLIKEAFKNQNDDEKEDGELCEHDSDEKLQNLENNVKEGLEVIDNHSVTNIEKKVKSRKRHLEIESLVAIKKVKKKKYNKKEKDDDNNYVLIKLFAKSGVKNALQHDEVVGLAEKEKRYKLKEEASRKARNSVRAIKLSMK